MKKNEKQENKNKGTKKYNKLQEKKNGIKSFFLNNRRKKINK